MDSDDIADLTKFEKQMTYLNSHPDIDVIGTNAVEFVDSKDNVVSTRIMPENDEDLKKFAHGRCPMIQPTVIFRVQAVKDAGSYLHSPLTEDYDLYIRMIKNGCIFHTFQEVLYFIRTSDDFFSRRGGIKYLKPILGFKYKHYKGGFYTFKEFIKTSTASLIMSLMPNSLRTFLYKKFWLYFFSNKFFKSISNTCLSSCYRGSSIITIATIHKTITLLFIFSPN